MNRIARTLTTIAALAAATIALPGIASATPGHYTTGGDVLTTLSVAGDGCATITWPRGGTSVTCDTEQVTHRSIVTGDRFGASITSSTGGAVACRVLDLTTGDLIYRVIRDAYGYDGFQRDQISALALIKDRYGSGIDEDRLVDQLKRQGIVEMRRKSRDWRETAGRSMAESVAHTMIAFYNAGARTQRVDPWWNIGVVGAA